METKQVYQGMLSSECWTVQMWGTKECQSCPYHAKNMRHSCGGKKILATGKNKNGYEIDENGFTEEAVKRYEKR